MEEKAIEEIINAKFSDWLSSITDPAVSYVVERNTIITGGCIASMLLDEPINDFDVYMRTEEAAYLLAKYYCNMAPPGVEPEPTENRITIKLPNGRGIRKRSPQGKYQVAYISPLAITLTDKIQFTVRFFGSPSEIHQNYDFLHCKAYWESRDRRLVIHSKVRRAIEKKKLIYVGSAYPVASVVRTKKFVKRGWKMDAGQLIKMSLQISDLDLSDKEQLKEQLVGMYAEDLTKVVEDTKVDENGQVDRASLFKAISKHVSKDDDFADY